MKISNYITPILLSILIAGCGSDADSKKANTNEGSIKQQNQNWSPEEHTVFLSQKQLEWDLHKFTFNNTYSIDAYMQMPEVDGYDEGLITVEDGSVVNFLSVDRGGRESDLKNVLTADMMFEKALYFQALMKDPYLQDHCTAEYDFKEAWLFPYRVYFSCDEYVPDRNVQILKITNFQIK